MALSYKNDSQQDERLNPATSTAAALADQEQQTGYDRDFKSMVNSPETGLSDLEATNNQYRYGGSRPAAPKKVGLKGWFTKKRATTTGIIGGVLAALGIGGGLLTTTLGPIAFLENIVDDLNDSISSMEVGGVRLMRAKIPSEDRAAALRGCTKLSIRCKFTTLSDTQVRRLRAAGITVNPSSEYRNLLSFNRTVPATYTFRGQDFSPEEWAEQLNTNDAARRAQLRANKMSYLSVSDNRFIRATMKRFGLSKRPPELSGLTKRERVESLLNRAGTNNPADINFTPVEGSDRFTLDGDPSGHEYTQEQVNSMRADLESNTASPRRPVSSAGRASIGALSVLGAADMACSIRNMIAVAAQTAKVANQMELARFAMGISSKISEMKSGDISPEDAEALGEFLGETDNRQTITDIAGSISIDGDSVAPSNEVATTENPNRGRNALDSSLYAMSTNGGVAAGNASLSLGVSQNQLLQGFSDVSGVLNAVNSLGTDGDVNTCQIIQHWGVRLLGIIGSVAIGIATGGGFSVGQVAIAAGMIGMMITLENTLNAALEGSVIESADLLNNPTARGDAVWTGMAAILGSSAQSRGLTPAGAGQLGAYQNNWQAQQANEDRIALEREDASPYDITNQYSFVGSVARSGLRYLPTQRDSLAFLGNIGSFVGSSFSTLLSPKASALTRNDPARFEQCQDPAYTRIGIAADVQCNVRYVMPDGALDEDPLQVAQWMEDRGYVESDTETGFPAGYTPPEPEQSQGMVLDFVTGTVDDAIGQFYNDRVGSWQAAGQQNLDYAFFLDYCAFRTLPYGEVTQDNFAVNEAANEWIDGSKCMEDSDMLDKFRAYTLYVSTNDALDEDGTFEQTTAGGADAPGSSDSTGNQTKQQLAQQIIASGNLQTGGFSVQPTIQSIANGAESDTLPCGINIYSLPMIAALTAEGSLLVTSLNRGCDGTNPGNVRGSRHVAGNGSAIDFGSFKSQLVRGRDNGSYEILRIIMPILQEAGAKSTSGVGSMVGQSNCRQPQSAAIQQLIATSPSVVGAPDSCNHLHVAVPPSADTSLQTGPGAW